MRLFWIGVIGCFLAIGARPALALVNSNIAQDTKYRQEFLKTKETKVTDPFLDHLKRGYIQLSESEWKQQDKKNSKIYAQKALMIMHGRTVEPTEIVKLALPKSKLDPLIEGRQFLFTSFASNLKQLFPEAAAQAQLMFDCWAEQEMDGRKPEDIVYCKGGFAQVRSDINTFLKNPAAFPKREVLAQVAPISEIPQAPITQSKNKDEPLAVAWPFTAPALMVSRDISSAPVATIVSASAVDTKAPADNPFAKPGKTPASYKAFFAKGKSDLDLPTQKLLDKISQDAAQYSPDRIQIISYQETSAELTEQRILSVATYLVDKGVKPELLDLRAYEAVPLTTKEQSSRYCEINFEQRID